MCILGAFNYFIFYYSIRILPFLKFRNLFFSKKSKIWKNLSFKSRITGSHKWCFDFRNFFLQVFTFSIMNLKNLLNDWIFHWKFLFNENLFLNKRVIILYEQLNRKYYNTYSRNITTILNKQTFINHQI